MNRPSVSDIVEIINEIAPARFAEAWDNPGLQVGDGTSSVGRIMVALDACLESIDAAIEKRCSLLLTHHPLIFKPLKRVSRQDAAGALIYRALEGGLSIVALHTNYDVAVGGVNDLLAERLGLSETVPLQVTGSDEYVKLGIFVPTGHEDKVLEALFRFSGAIGNYSDCSFRVTGTGTFRPLKGADPFIGKEGELESVEESRIELLIWRDELDAAISAMKKVHPYEEPAFDIYRLYNKGKLHGLGRIGFLQKEVTLQGFAEMVKDQLEATSLRCVGEKERKVKRVALCGGSGASLLREARFKGADVLVTGDVKYHDAREAEALGIAIVDAGHFATERLMIDGLAGALGQELPRRGFSCDILRFAGEKEPFFHV